MAGPAVRYNGTGWSGSASSGSHKRKSDQTNPIMSFFFSNEIFYIRSFFA